MITIMTYLDIPPIVRAASSLKILPHIKKKSVQLGKYFAIFKNISPPLLAIFRLDWEESGISYQSKIARFHSVSFHFL